MSLLNRKDRREYYVAVWNLGGAIFYNRMQKARSGSIRFVLLSNLIGPVLAIFMGWDQGLLEMCVGEKRKLKIPSKMGYGEHCSPPKIPDERSGGHVEDVRVIVLSKTRPVPLIRQVYEARHRCFGEKLSSRIHRKGSSECEVPDQDVKSTGCNCLLIIAQASK
ncbi:peptidyl-prolyl cis-trans isomerase FKBP15-1 [Tanacetum coccineum]